MCPAVRHALARLCGHDVTSCCCCTSFQAPCDNDIGRAVQDSQVSSAHVSRQCTRFAAVTHSNAIMCSRSLARCIIFVSRVQATFSRQAGLLSAKTPVHSSVETGTKATIASGSVVGEGSSIQDRASIKRAVIGNNCKCAHLPPCMVCLDDQRCGALLTWHISHLRQLH